MMKLPSYLKKSRHGIFYYRLVYYEAGKRRETRTSLRTRCPVEAMSISYALSARIKPHLNRYKGKTMAIDPRDIDPANIRELKIQGLKIESGRMTADYIETSDDPKVADKELALLATMMKKDWSPETKAFFQAEEQEIAQMLEEERWTLCYAIKQFLVISKGGLAESSQKGYQGRMDTLANLIGPNRQVSSITKPDCVQALDKLTLTAPHDSKRNTSIDGRLSSGTIKDTLTLWRSFFEWLIERDVYKKANPIGKLKPPAAPAEDGGAEAFDENDLKQIFQWNLFKEAKRPHQYFAPLIALYTGARSNEIAQLRLRDIDIDDGLLCFKIVHDPNGSDGGTRLKNAASKRTIPVHPKLIELGLSDYIEDLKLIGAKRLFPYLQKDASGKREKNQSRDFNEFLKSIGVYQYRAKVFHSFRDTLIDMLAQKSVDIAYRSDYVGHAREGTQGKSYQQKILPSKMQELVMPFIDYPNVDLSEFSYTKGQWNDWMQRNIAP